MPKQVLPDLAPDAPVATRPHWVKVRFRDVNIPVGIVHQYLGESYEPPGQSGVLWVFDHRTDDTMLPLGIVSPMGLDVGVLDYLLRQSPQIDQVHFWPDGAREMLRVPFHRFILRRGDAKPVHTVTGGDRLRVFVPTAEWEPFPFYAETRPPYWDVTQLTPDGQIEAQHVAVPR